MQTSQSKMLTPGPGSYQICGSFDLGKLGITHSALGGLSRESFEKQSIEIIPHEVNRDMD